MSTNTFLFPDVNVWVALAHQWHPHHQAATLWIDPLGPEFRLYFSRLTQLGLLRILTTRSAMAEDVMTQAAAWRVYDRFLQDTRNHYMNEPADLEARLRRNTSRREVSPKQWADGYVAAFAIAAGLRLVTFDYAIAGASPNAILLRA